MLEQALSLLGRFTQATRLLRLTTPLGANTLLAECVRGEEAISAGFTFTISALSPDAGIALRSLLGQPALIELLTVSGGQARPFHGYLTAVELNGANGGMARYTLTLQPWSAFMARTRDSRVFQDLTVFDILDVVFGAWQGRGKLAPQWRFDIADRSVYPVRSLTTQYQESDLAFAERLMNEEGLFYFFEHQGDAASPSLGSHEMVIADHNGAFQPNVQASVRYTQPGSVMQEDSIDRWRSELRLQTNGVELRSWDYRTLSARPVSAAGVQPEGASLVSSDVPGAYAYATRRQGERIANNQMQALEARREVFIGAGTVRTLAPGTTFTLAGQAQLDLAGSDDARSFVITRTVHLMHNNLSADLQSDVLRRVGKAALALLIEEEQKDSLHAVGSKPGERPLYRNRIDAIRAKVPYRASRTDGHGRLLHPRPTVQGQQSAVVVGPAGAVIHTDRDHRVKVQFHWQRGAQSHSRLDHPAPDGHSGAPADDSAGTWVRVAAPLAPVAGANWGSYALPRVGQEVLVDFLEGNIDRPVIIGALYNGKGQMDAQNNQASQGAGAATGNAPAWFPGEAAAHAHPAVLSGLKSQAMSGSQGGSGAYSQLLFDDSPGQSRVVLQRHASAHKGTAELNMGHLRHQADNQRLQPAGFGAELKTEHGAALRSGKGMLLAANVRAGASGAQMDAREAQAQIESSAQLAVSLATTAQKHNATLKHERGAAEAGPEKLTAISEFQRSAEVAGGVTDGMGAGEGGQGSAAAFGAPQLQLSAPSGITALSPASAILASAASSSVNAAHDINTVAQGDLVHIVRTGISLFSYGKADDGQKPNQETGVRLHGASGKVSVQAHSDQIKATASEGITVASVTKGITIAGNKHVLLTAQGASLKLEGGNIMLHGPGKIEFKASMKELTGPKSDSFPYPDFPREKLYAGHFQLKDKESGLPLAGMLYTKRRADGKVIFGTTDADGHTQVVPTAEPEKLEIRFEAVEKYHREKTDEEEVNRWFNEDENE
jgi:type VI secretion system secreted protein VgrG